MGATADVPRYNVVNTRLNDSELGSLLDTAEVMDLPIAELVRRGILMYLESVRKPEVEPCA